MFFRIFLKGMGKYHFDYIIATVIPVTWYMFNKMWHPKVITHSRCRGWCGGADRLGKVFFPCRLGLSHWLASRLYEAPVGPLGAGWMMARGVDTASLALMRRGDLVGMMEGCWTRAQSGDCLSVQPVPLGFYPWVGISKENAWPLTFSPTFVLTLCLSLPLSLSLSLSLSLIRSHSLFLFYTFFHLLFPHSLSVINHACYTQSILSLHVAPCSSSPMHCHPFCPIHQT